jgi:hypothetical protein
MKKELLSHSKHYNSKDNQYWFLGYFFLEVVITIWKILDLKQ